MTAALSQLGPSDRHWILRYIRLQQASDRRVQAALHGTLDSASKALNDLEGRGNISAAVQRAQLLGTRGIVTRILKELYKELLDIVESDQQKAAELATKLLYEDEKRIWQKIEPDPDARTKIMDSQGAKARRNIQTVITRVLETEVPLSTRVWRAEAIARGQVNRVVNAHLGRGSSAKDMAKEVKSLINPNTPGGVSYSAMRLARTEINNAFHAQSMHDAAERPWIDEVQWNLSKSHPERQPPCLCEVYAAQRLFPSDEIPKKPHPNCLCSITPVLPDLDEVFERFSNGEFGSYLKNP